MVAEDIRKVRASLAGHASRLVAGATDRRFDATDAALGDIVSRLVAMEELVRKMEIDIAVARQQADEALAFLRIQHDVVRDLLEELRPTLARRRQP